MSVWILLYGCMAITVYAIDRWVPRDDEDDWRHTWQTSFGIAVLWPVIVALAVLA